MKSGQAFKIENMESEQKGRLFWLDVLRALAACAVVMMHTLTGAVDIMNTAAYEDGQWMLLIMDMVTWCVPMFLMISGFLFLDPDREIGFGKMLKKYCVRIVLALLLFGIPFSCMELILAERTFRMGMLWEGLWMVLTMRSWSHLWYLYLILVLYALTPALKWVLKRLPYWGIVLGLAYFLVGSSGLPFLNQFVEGAAFPVLPDGSIYVFYYVFGYCLHRKEKRVGANHMLVWGVGILIVLGEMVRDRLLRDASLQMAYNYPLTVLLSVGIMLFAMSFSEQFQHNGWSLEHRPVVKYGKKLIVHLSRLSFTIYLIHPVFLNVMYKVMKVTPVDFSFGISLPVFFAVTLLCSIFSAWILHKITPLRKHVL